MDRKQKSEWEKDAGDQIMREAHVTQGRRKILSLFLFQCFLRFFPFFSLSIHPRSQRRRRKSSTFSSCFFSFASKILRILSPGFLFGFFRRRGQIGTKEKKTEANHRGTTEEEAGERGKREVAGLHVRVSVSVSALEVP